MPWYIRLLHGVQIALYTIIFAGLMGGSSLLVSTKPSETVRRYTRSVEFDYVSWTLDALSVKLNQVALDTPFYFTEGTRHQIVVDYLHLMDEIISSENRVNFLYTDPHINNPAVASLALQTELNHLYTRQNQLAPLAEAVLQEQISTTLTDLGLTTSGQPIPPVFFHITSLPYNLIISPRDKIQQDAAISLVHNLSVEQQISLENRVDSGLDVSTLVVPVGGIGSYPTMVMRSTAIDWLTDTIAHEWIHNWLTLRPLGMNYYTTPEMRTMNETTASIAGREIGMLVLKGYYPELATSYELEAVNLSPSSTHGDFNFNTEMHITRVHVDELLAQGKITEAESYMEQRRQFIWNQGCSQCAIRKLNQAYFSFYGAYADTPGGAAGEDLVGPAVRALRAQSATLGDFLKAIAKMDTFKQLQAAVSP